MSLGVIVQDNAIHDAQCYRAVTLLREFKDFGSDEEVFHHIAITDPTDQFTRWLQSEGFWHSLSFYRKSPTGQSEPHYIHHDAMMGDWTAILYLNPEPHPGDGTVFWEHKSGDRSGDHDMDDVPQFRERFRVKAQFNRAVIFPSKWFHSRALFENYGTGDDARLIQVAFGKVT